MSGRDSVESNMFGTGNIESRSVFDPAPDVDATSVGDDVMERLKPDADGTIRIEDVATRVTYLVTLRPSTDPGSYPELEVRKVFADGSEVTLHVLWEYEFIIRLLLIRGVEGIGEGE